MAMRFHVASTVRSAALRRSVLSLAKNCSIGLRSGLYAGRKVWTVCREEEELGTCGADCAADRLPFVAAEVVDDDDIARLKGGDEHLLDIGQKGLAIDWAVDDAGRVDAIVAQRGQEGQRPPAALGNLGDQPFAAQRPSMAAGHIGLGPGLVDEDETRGIKLVLIPFPLCPPPCDVGTILFAGAQAFF